MASQYLPRLTHQGSFTFSWEFRVFSLFCYEDESLSSHLCAFGVCLLLNYSFRLLSLLKWLGWCSLSTNCAQYSSRNTAQNKKVKVLVLIRYSNREKWSINKYKIGQVVVSTEKKRTKHSKEERKWEGPVPWWMVREAHWNDDTWANFWKKWENEHRDCQHKSSPSRGAAGAKTL